MRVLVLGADGMLGHKVMQTVDGATGTVRGPPHPALEGMDVLEGVDIHAVPDVVSHVAADVVVNCIGIVKQRSADMADVIAVNALFPHQLARLPVRLIHISTDCVFDGRRGDYDDADVPNAIDLYGRSKALGEFIEPEDALILRTSVIGRELWRRSGLLEWFLIQEATEGYTGAWFSGVTTNWLARTIRSIIFDHPTLAGLYNVAGPRISKYDLLELLAIVYGRPHPEPDDEVEVDRTLDGSRFAGATGLEAPSWESMIAGMAADETPYEEWR